MLQLLEILLLIVPLLVSIAYLTLAERKVMGSMQRRLGPNKVGQDKKLSKMIDTNKYYKDLLFYSDKLINI